MNIIDAVDLEFMNSELLSSILQATFLHETARILRAITSQCYERPIDNKATSV